MRYPKERHSVIFITAPSKKEARHLAAKLIEDRLAACVNVVSDVHSVFRWQGKVDHAQEMLLIAKTRTALVGKLIKRVKAWHTYEVPEIIALPVILGNRKYLDWIDDATR